MISLLHWSLQLWKEQATILRFTSEHTAVFCLSLSASFRLLGNQIILLSFLPLHSALNLAKKKFQVYCSPFFDLYHQMNSYNSEKFDSFFKKIDYGLSVARQRTSRSFSTLSLSFRSLHSSRVGKPSNLPSLSVRGVKSGLILEDEVLDRATVSSIRIQIYWLCNSTPGFSIGFLTRNKLVSNLIWTSLRKIA